MPDCPSPVAKYRKAHLTVAEVLFDETCANTVDVDVVRYRCRAKPVPGSQCAKCYTLWVDLGDNPKCLLANMSRTTRSQIRRAQRESLRYEFTSTPTRNCTEQFFDFYDSFARSKNLKASVDRHRVLGFLNQGALDLSRVTSPEGRVLVWHANLRSGRYACCLYSASLFRREGKRMAAYIGRSNRLHHWSDMLRFRGEGFRIYDFGGWYAGTQDQILLRINRFKECFGGALVAQYNCDQAVTWKGALGLWFKSRIHSNPIFGKPLGTVPSPR